MWVIAVRLWVTRWVVERGMGGQVRARDRLTRFSQHANPEVRTGNAFPPFLGKVHRVAICKIQLLCPPRASHTASGQIGAERRMRKPGDTVFKLLISMRFSFVNIYVTHLKGQNNSHGFPALSIVPIIRLNIQHFPNLHISATRGPESASSEGCDDEQGTLSLHRPSK